MFFVPNGVVIWWDDHRLLSYVSLGLNLFLLAMWPWASPSLSLVLGFFIFIERVISRLCIDVRRIRDQTEAQCLVHGLATEEVTLLLHTHSIWPHMSMLTEHLFCARHVTFAEWSWEVSVSSLGKELVSPTHSSLWPMEGLHFMTFLMCRNNHKAVLWNWDDNRGEAQVRQLSVIPPPAYQLSAKVLNP